MYHRVSEFLLMLSDVYFFKLRFFFFIWITTKSRNPVEYGFFIFRNKNVYNLHIYCKFRLDIGYYKKKSGFKSD